MQVTGLAILLLRVSYLSTLPTPYQKATSVTKPPGCYFNGRYYAVGIGIKKTCLTKLWCYGTYCDEHSRIVEWEFRKPVCKTTTKATPSKTITTTKTPTTIAHDTTKYGCYKNGKRFAPGQDIASGSYEENGWCFGEFCDYKGEIIQWNSRCNEITSTQSTTNILMSTTNDLPTHTTSKQTSTVGYDIVEGSGTEPSTTSYSTSQPTTLEDTTTDSPTTVPLLGCFVDGKLYGYGEEINSGYDEDSNWCYGSFCSDEGEVLEWDNFRCKTTTTEDTTIPFTTTPSSRDEGCYINGKYYITGESITSNYDPISNKCDGLYCDQHGQAIPWDRWNCRTSTTSKPHTTTPRKDGCYVGGKFFTPGQQIESGYSVRKNWCYGRYCDHTGQIISWDKFHCRTTTTSTTTFSPTTFPPTTREETTVPKGPGCYIDGNYFHPGQEIDSGSDGNQWCFGRTCEYGNTIQHWDNFNCNPTTTLLTTIPDTTTSS